MKIERLLNRPLISDEQIAERPPRHLLPGFEEWLQKQPRLPIRGRIDSNKVEAGDFCLCFRADLEQDGFEDDSNKSLALKVFSLRGERGNPQMIAKEDRKDYERLKESLIGPFVVSTLHLITGGPDRMPWAVQIQPWIDGKKIGNYPIKEILADPIMTRALREFTLRLLIMRLRDRSSKPVDPLGFAWKRELSFMEKLLCVSLFTARNLVWDGRALYLIDTTTHRYDKRQTPLRIRVAALLSLIRDLAILYTASSLIRKLGLQENARSREISLFRESFGQIIHRLEHLKSEYGLDYRIVGGVAAASILEEPISPFRQDGSKRDVDVVFLNPQCLPKEIIRQFQEWADEQAVSHPCFPQVSINCVEPLEKVKTKCRLTLLPPRWLFLGRFASDGNRIYMIYRELKVPLPEEAFETKMLQYDGVRFPSFPPWVHYGLYLTRNGGYIKMKDREKVKGLKKIALSSVQGQKYTRQMEMFLQEVRNKYHLLIFLNKIRLATNKLWTTAGKIKTLFSE